MKAAITSADGQPSKNFPNRGIGRALRDKQRKHFRLSRRDINSRLTRY